MERDEAGAMKGDEVMERGKKGSVGGKLEAGSLRNCKSRKDIVCEKKISEVRGKGNRKRRKETQYTQRHKHATTAILKYLRKP